MAIGSLAQYHSLPAALKDPPDAPLMDGVLLIPPTVLLENGLTALQCLIFTSTYYFCLVKPCQAHDYILTASMLGRNLLKSASLDPESQKFIRRALWAVLLIKNKRATQLDLTTRSVVTLDNGIPCCPGHHQWMRQSYFLSGRQLVLRTVHLPISSP